MFKRLSQWRRSRRMRRSTERELKLLALLERCECERDAYRGHYQALQQDFAALWDDHQALQVRYAETRYPRMRDWAAGQQTERVRA